MKTFATIFCFILMLSSGFAQVTWYNQYSMVTSPLTDICFIDQDNGWISGWNGTMLHSTNGGVNWSQESIPTGDDYYSVYFNDEQHGWASGFSGRVAYTTNGGESWFIQISTTSNDLYSICFLDNLNGWIAGGSYGSYPPFVISRVIIHTEDGGDTWYTQYSENDKFPLKRMKMLNANTGYAVSEDGFLMYTTNGGLSWSEKVINTSYLLHDMCFVSTSTGWVSGEYLGIPHYGAVLKTTDEGNTWTEEPLGNKEVLQSVYFTDAMNGWVVGNDSLNEPIIYYTTDGGDNWIPQTPPSNAEALSRVYFHDANTGWAVGDNGSIISTIDGVVGIDDYSDKTHAMPARLKLEQNYPNPFHGETTIGFQLPETAKVNLSITSILGQRITTLVNETKPAGNYSVSWDGTDASGQKASPGIYILRLRTGNQVVNTRVNLMR